MVLGEYATRNLQLVGICIDLTLFSFGCASRKISVFSSPPPTKLFEFNEIGLSRYRCPLFVH
jgi:hypothetical protein